MSFVNSNWYIALAFCFIFFVTGRQLGEISEKSSAKIGMTLILILFALPSLLFPLGLIIPTLSNAAWYCSFRAINRIELMTSMIAPFTGFITFKKTFHSYYRHSGVSIMQILKPLAFPFSILYVSVCFLKPLVLPIDKSIIYQENWINGVMMPSSAANSGPAAILTIMNQINGFEDYEYNVSAQTYSSADGADIWYLARFSIEKGFRYRFIQVQDITNAPFPSLIRVKTETSNHCIALLNNESGMLTIGDPLRGKFLLDSDEFDSLYTYSGLVLSISPNRASGDE